MIDKTLKLLAVATLVLLTSAFPAATASASFGRTAVVELRCLNPTDADLATPVRLVVDATPVELWCGDRLLVTDGVCRVERGAELTVVPCVRDGG